MNSFILIVMFMGFPSGGAAPFVGMQRFETEEACKQAISFVMDHHPGFRAKCIKDTKPQ